jgi:NDP-sugar pyrophosphorylase family protein
MSLRCVHEQTLLGTGGGIRNALPLLGEEPFIVYNGDIYAELNLAAAIALHRETGAKMTMILREDPSADRLGSIEVDATGRVVRILNEGPPSSVATQRCMFTGVYILSPGVRDELPESGCIVRHSLRRWLAAGDRVSAVVDRGLWFDLGTPEAYADVVFRALDGRITLAETVNTQQKQWIDPSVSIDTAVLGEYVAIEQNVQLRAGASLRRAIVWSGSDVCDAVDGSIVTPHARLRIVR